MRLMADSRTIPSRGPYRRNWVCAAILAAVTLWAGVASLRHTSASATRRANPELAAKIAPWDGRFLAAAVSARFATSLDKSGDGRSAGTAIAALLKDPTAVEAAIVLAMQAELRGDSAAANRLFAYALLLSRREFRPHLWAIETAVTAGDYRAALRHYDLAMRTSGYAQEVLFPILGNALREETIRQEVIALMQRNPAWRDSFIHYVAVMPETGEAASYLLPELAAHGIPFKRSDALALVKTLVDREMYDRAWALDQFLSGKQTKNRSRDPQLLGRLSGSSSFDWTIPDVAGASVSFTRNGDEGGVDFSLAPQSGGTILNQLIMAPVGTYRFAYTMSNLRTGSEADIRWQIRCRTGQELASLDVVADEQTKRSGAVSFIIPDDCRVQVLGFFVRNKSGYSDVTGRITSAGLAPGGA